MTKFDLTREANIAKGIKYLKQNPGVKKSKVAYQFHVPYHLFKSRLEGRPAQNTKGGHNQNLS